MTPIFYYRGLLRRLYSSSDLSLTFDREFAGRIGLGTFDVSNEPVSLLAAYLSLNDTVRYELQKSIITNSYVMMKESLDQLMQVEKFVLRSFGIVDWDIQFGTCIFPLGGPNAVCTEIEKYSSYQLLFDPDILAVLELSIKNLMLVQAKIRDRSLPFSIDHVAAFSYEYFADLLDRLKSKKHGRFSGKVPNPVSLVSDRGLVSSFSMIARRSFDFIHYHEWGHIFSRRLPRDHEIGLPFSTDSISIEISSDASLWVDELWADRISAVTLAAMLREMETEEKTANLEATLYGIAVVLSFSEFLESLTGNDQSVIAETPGGRIVSLHPKCAHPPAYMRLFAVLGYFKASMSTDERIEKTAITILSSFRDLWQRGEKIAPAARHRLIDELGEMSFD